jgi:hypothetical protein
MAAADIAINIAAQFTGKNAFQKADKATAGLQRSVKNLGMALGVALSARAITNFSKLSVKAFAEDEKAARSLALAVANTGNAFAQLDVESFIQRMQRATGVLDDALRPAFRTLITTTGDVKKSQDALALALDISAGTGRDLNQVSLALARGYAGQTTGLSRLGAGLSKATLKAGDMDEITKELQARFSGQALEATKGFAGQMNLLTVAVNDAKEAIGKGLVDALGVLGGGQGSTGGAITVINDMATGIAEGAKNIAFMIKQFEALKPVVIAIGSLLLLYFAPVTAAIAALTFLLAKGGQNLKKSQFRQGAIPGGMGNVSMSTGSQDTQRAQTAARKKAEKDAVNLTRTGNTLKKIDNDLTARKLALTGDEKALVALEKKFDVERIGLYSALNQSTDGETRMRLLSLIAIKDQNAAMAGMIMKASQAEDALKALTDAIRLTIRALLDSIANQVKQLQAATGGGGGYSAADVNTQSIAAASLNQGLAAGLPMSEALSGARYAAQGAANYIVSVNVAGSVSTERDLVSAITQGIINNQASGIPISYSTSFR